MTANPKSVNESAFAVDVLRLFEQYRIDDLPVVNAANEIVGYIDIQDLPKMKVMKERRVEEVLKFESSKVRELQANRTMR